MEKELETLWAFLDEMRTEIESAKEIFETILENQQIIIQQNLFVLAFLIANKTEREELKTRLDILFEESPCDD